MSGTKTKRSRLQIDLILARARKLENFGKTLHPLMTYEQGVRAALEWVVGNTDHDTFEVE